MWGRTNVISNLGGKKNTGSTTIGGSSGASVTINHNLGVVPSYIRARLSYDLGGGNWIFLFIESGTSYTLPSANFTTGSYNYQYINMYLAIDTVTATSFRVITTTALPYNVTYTVVWEAVG